MKGLDPRFSSPSGQNEAVCTTCRGGLRYTQFNKYRCHRYIVTNIIWKDLTPDWNMNKNIHLIEKSLPRYSQRKIKIKKNYIQYYFGLFLIRSIFDSNCSEVRLPVIDEHDSRISEITPWSNNLSSRSELRVYSTTSVLHVLSLWLTKDLSRNRCFPWYIPLWWFHFFLMLLGLDCSRFVALLLYVVESPRTIL